MAYNPFDFFRRNQKIIFAMITVMVMFMFVLSSGLGGKADFFTWFPEWLGAKRGAGETVATIDGKNFTTGNMAQIERQRSQVNELMIGLLERSQQRLAKQLADTAGKGDREMGQSAINIFLQSRAQGYFSQEMSMQMRIMQMQGRQPSQQDIANAILGEMARQGQTLNMIVQNPASKAEDMQLAQQALKLFKLDNLRIKSPQFFATADNKTSAGRMEFELWRRKADKLGIVVTPDVAESMAIAELGGVVNEADIKEQLRILQERDQTLTGEKFRLALADEFRVRMAQNAVLGPTDETDVSSSQAASSPYQQFQFYQNQTNESRYGMIRIPVENYLAKVTGEPTPQEMTDLFNKHRTQEPSPFADRPGFKEPRKLKLEYLMAQGNEPFYKAASEKLQPQAEMQTRVAGLLAAPIGPSGMTTILAGPALLNIKTEDALAGAYDIYKSESNSNISSVWGLTFPSTRADITDETFAQPKLLAALSATMAGSLMAQGNPMAAPLVMLERARIEERNAKARAQMSLMTLPVPGSLPMLSGAIAFANRMPQPLPLAVLKPGTEQKLRERLSQRILNSDLQTFLTEITKLGKSVDKASARSYLEKFIKDRDLKTGASQEFRDAFSIDRDPGLVPLYERYKKDYLEKNRFAFVEGRDFFGPQYFNRGNQSKTTFYEPEEFASRTETDPEILVWRTAEQPAEEPKDMNEPKTKAKILAAWKLSKARDLAKAKAEEIAKEAPTLGTNTEVLTQKLIDIETKLKTEVPGSLATNRVRYFEIPRVAPVRVEMSFNFERPTVSGFQLLPNEDIPIPTSEIQNALLANREKEIGTAFTQADLPKNNYYVGVLIGKEIHTTSEFARTVFTAPGIRAARSNNDLSSVMTEGFNQDARVKARLTAVSLLKAELKVDKENEKLLAGKSDE